MEKSRIVFHSVIKNRYEAGLIEQSLRATDYDVSFIPITNEMLKLSEKDIDIILLEPSLEDWEWLDFMISFSRKYPDLFVVLYSRDVVIKDSFHRSLSIPVFLANDVTVLRDNMPYIVDQITRSREPKKSVLFVDDEPSLLNSYKRMLRKSPWNVFTAPSAETALETLDGEQVDLVVTDMKMPKIHGIELIAKIRQKFETLPIIVCSAYAGMKTDEELRFHRISDFIEKPVDHDVLASTIENVLTQDIRSFCQNDSWNRVESKNLSE